MIKTHTSKLFYGKFPYVVKISDQVPGKPLLRFHGSPRSELLTACKELVAENEIPHRYYTEVYPFDNMHHFTRVDLNVFLRERKDYDLISAAFNKHVVKLVEPANTSHEDWLKKNTSIVVRENLIYGRYRYIVSFKSTGYNVDGDHNSEIIAWINSNFEDRVCGKDYLCRNGWYVRLYLTNQMDMTHVALAFGGQINTVTHVALLSEID